MLSRRSSGVPSSVIVVIWLTTLMSCFLASSFGAMTTLLPDDEVNGLKEVGKSLGKTWDFSVDPCSGKSGWATANPTEGSENAVTCNCSFPNGTCHVVSIVLNSQGLKGVLPAGELLKLPYLSQLELNRNYISGRIPAEWGSMALVNISVLGNRLSGVIPVELGNITTLRNLTLEANLFSGPLPSELGKLVDIQRILFSSNYFTGPLPETLANLINMKDFRISQNNFTGKIPSFIKNWRSLQKLAMQASGLEGPIPLEISYLSSLTDLRISDITGPEMKFPPLGNMTSMKTLILKSCNIIGPLPDYLGEMTTLKQLDLSFNKLVGEIPSRYSGLVKVKFMYLTGNLLNGTVPDWMKKGQNIDLSYNNFSYGNSGVSTCQQYNVNLYGSSSLAKNLSGDVPCLKSLTCPKKGYSFHINCGGDTVHNGSTTYEDDRDSAGPSKFFQSRYNWGFSSTGNFMDNDIDIDTYTTPNVSTLLMRNPELYTRARLSPLSLTYYGYCLLTGNYTVNLHFAEIMFTNDHNYSSLGRRIFDVYIQGQLVLKDFNIVDEAGGVGKAVTRNFSSIAVTDGTIEIRFYWAGKGTTALTSRGTYGPLISAISVDPEFTPPEGGKKMSTAAVIGIVASVVALTFIVLGILWWRGCLGRKNMMDQELRGLDLQTGSFTLRQIKAATNNFDPANKIGEGGFGSVYKGLLSDGSIIAVKQLSSKSKQGNREFVNEIGMISALQHPHLVKLYGCCIEGNQLLLVYEYMENNCLARALFGKSSSECKLKLDWPTRQKICIGIARGLAFLHEESRLKIVHRDIKATNVLLDEHLNPKISDFGLAKLDEEENTHISTRIAGTIGYMAPEYAMRGYLTDKADVYSFGIVALEIVSGKSNTSFRPKEECVYLLDWALVLKERGNLMELVDEKLDLEFNKEEVLRMLNVALLCTNASPTLRPTMSVVVSMLEGRATIKEFAPHSSITGEDVKFKAIRNHCQYNQDLSTSTIESLTHSTSIDGPWTGSTGSVPDLYPVNPDSQYWNDRNRLL